VNPEETGRNGTSNPYLFGTIQEALDAADAAVSSTVCVASGTYYEQLVVRGNTRILGEATGDVFLRPPETNLDTLPSAVDRTLLTVQTAVDRPIIIERMDVGGAGVCADSSGDGALRFEDVRLTSCGLGLRATGGSLVVERTPIKNHSIQGVLLRDMTGATFVDSELFGNGGAATPTADDEHPDYVRADVLSGVPQGGTLEARDVDDLTLRRMLIDDASWTDALILVDGGHLTVADTRIDLRGLARTGRDPAIIADADIDIDRVTLHGQGHGLLRASGTDRLVRVSNLAWRDDQPLEDPDAPGERHPVVRLELASSNPGGDGQSAFEARHISVNASSPTVAIDVGADNLDVLVFNAILWGVGDANGIVGQTPTGLGFGNVLTDDGALAADPVVTVQNIIDPVHIDYFTPGFGPTRNNVPSSDGGARCKGQNLSGQGRDLLGNDRPFEGPEGPTSPLKLPDLGAVELQEPCP
jgi:hypothetical protein